MFGISVYIAVPLIIFAYLSIGFIWACFLTGTESSFKIEYDDFKFDFKLCMFVWPIQVVYGVIILFATFIVETVEGFIRFKKFYVKELANYFTKLSEK